MTTPPSIAPADDAGERPPETEDEPDAHEQLHVAEPERAADRSGMESAKSTAGIATAATTASPSVPRTSGIEPEEHDDRRDRDERQRDDVGEESLVEVRSEQEREGGEPCAEEGEVAGIRHARGERTERDARREGDRCGPPVDPAGRPVLVSRPACADPVRGEPPHRAAEDERDDERGHRTVPADARALRATGRLRGRARRAWRGSRPSHRVRPTDEPFGSRRSRRCPDGSTAS